MASCRHWVVLLVVFFLEVIDLSCDWLFYTEVKDSTEPYVINNGYLHWTILVVASLGSLTFIFEVWNLVTEMFTDRGLCVSPDTVSMVSTWVEDVPQIAVALVIAVNTQGVVHWVQYIKAAWSLLEAGVRALGQCVFCCRLSNRQNRSTDCLVSLSKFLAQIVVLGCSIGIFMHLLQENH